MKYALFLHLISVVIWVGGMIFAYQFLRPAAAAVLEPPQRLNLWVNTFARFFPWVWVAILLLPITGYWMIAKIGGFAAIGINIHLMQAVGIVMIAVFLHVYFAPYKRLKQLVAAQNYAEAGKQLQQIRLLVGINVVLGIVVLASVRLLS